MADERLTKADARVFRPELLPEAGRFGGITYDAAEDCARLTTQLARVDALMRDGEWRTLAQIRAVAGGTEAACSARLRDLRKEKFGALYVDRERVEGERGLWRYRVRRV